MSSILSSARSRMGRAESQFREAFERLKQNKPQLIPKGSKLSQNNVAKEAGVDPSALRKSRFPALIDEIQRWIDSHPESETGQSPRQMALVQRARNRTLIERIASLQAQRDEALSRLVDAEARILELTMENERLRAVSPSNVSVLSRARGKRSG